MQREPRARAFTNLDRRPPVAGSACRVFLDDAQANLYGRDCRTPGSENCKPASYDGLITTCLSDLP